MQVVWNDTEQVTLTQTKITDTCPVDIYTCSLGSKEFVHVLISYITRYLQFT